MFCKSCGNEVKAGNKFCAHCGQPITEKLRENSNIKQSKRKRLLLLCMGGMVLLFWGIIGCFKFAEYRNQKSQKQEVQSVSTLSVMETMKSEEIEEAATDFEKEETQPETESRETLTEQTEVEPSAEWKPYEIIVADVTWHEAEVLAEQRGGHLAVIRSDEEEQEIESLLNESATYLSVAWIGANNLTGEYCWITGEEDSYGHCHDGEPNNESGDEHYLAIYRQNGLWGWADLPDDVFDLYRRKIGYVVEYDQ